MKEHIKGLVRFTKYQDGNLYYITETGLEFTVPITDIGNAVFLSSDKAIMFMRWIRKHLELIGEKQNG